MKTVTLKADKRDLLGRKVKKLRQSGFLPGNVYGKKIKSFAVVVFAPDFGKVFAEVGETGIVELAIGGEKTPVLINNVQRNPVTDEIIHAEFLRVDLKEKVTTRVPVDLIGESPAEKEGRGTVVQYISEVEVEAYPADLPDKIEIDVGVLSEIDASLKVSDLKVDPGKVVIKAEPEQIIVKIEPTKEEKTEVVAIPTEVAEGASSQEGEAEAQPAPAEETKQAKKGGQ